MIKKFNTFKKIDEEFRPVSVSTTAFWNGKEDLRKIIISELLSNKSLTLDDYVKSNKSYINRLSINDQIEFNEVIDKLNLPVWQKIRN